MDTMRSDDTRFRDALGRLGRSLVDGLGQRFDLFSVELEEEKHRLFAVIFVALVSAFTAFLALGCLTLGVILLAGEANRLLAVFLLAGFYLLVSVGSALWLRHRIRTSPQPFAASLEELRKDSSVITGDGS